MIRILCPLYQAVPQRQGADSFVCVCVCVLYSHNYSSSLDEEEEELDPWWNPFFMPLCIMYPPAPTAPIPARGTPYFMAFFCRQVVRDKIMMAEPLFQKLTDQKRLIIHTFKVNIPSNYSLFTAFRPYLSGLGKTG